MGTAAQPGGRTLVILYDGVCGLCNGLIRFVLKRDPGSRFRFAPLQSPLAHDVLRRHGRNADDLNTVYVIADYRQPTERVLAAGPAVLQIFGTIGGGWRLLGILRVLPVALLNLGYKLVATNRYRLFGRYDRCPLPAAEDRDRFLDLA